MEGSGWECIESKDTRKARKRRQGERKRRSIKIGRARDRIGKPFNDPLRPAAGGAAYAVASRPFVRPPEAWNRTFGSVF